MALFGMAAHAQNAVAVYQKNGQVVNYLFSEKPKVSYIGDCLVMTTKDQNVQYSLQNLEKMEFTEIATGIDDATPTADSALLFSFRSGQVAVSHAQPGTKVTLFDTDGKTVSQQTVGDSGAATLSTQSLPRGTYIVQVGDTSYKISR